MKFSPNLGHRFRILYVVIGVVLVAATFAIGLEGWQRVILPILGGMAIVTGATGW